MRVTWWGHSTATIETGGVRLLTDPLLRNRLAHLHRRRGPRPGAGALDPHAVLISHLHADHLDVPSLRLLPAGVPLLVPRGAAAFLHRAAPELAHRCVELTAGDEVPVGAVRVRAVPAAHPAIRLPWSRHRAQPLGFTVHGPRTAWFAGDTGLFDEMRGLGPVDVALVPVGGWGPSLGPGHLDPAGAVEALLRCAPAHAVPVHFGTFWPIGLGRVRPDLFHRPGELFAERAATGAPGVRVGLLAPGESLRLPGSAGGPTGHPAPGADPRSGPAGERAGADRAAVDSRADPPVGPAGETVAPAW